MLGVVIMNTGTADAPTPEAIRAYLAEFLMDRNIINCPPLFWNPVVKHCILPKRPVRNAPRYQKFWTPEGSPFTLTSYKQRDEIQARLSAMLDEPVRVELGMRYGNPTTQGAIQALREWGAQRIVALPMYPQYTVPCGVTVLEHFHDGFDAVYHDVEQGKRPEVIEIREYWNAPGYIDILADSVREAGLPALGGKLLVTFHSIPLSYVSKRGDTYPETTKATAEQLADTLGISRDDLVLAYQSRFDKRTWLGPMLDAEVKRLGAQGATEIVVVSPIFSVDCIETAYDIEEHASALYREAAAAAGHSDASFRYVPALGAKPVFMDFIAGVIRDYALR